jgi:hypothetical protein
MHEFYTAVMRALGATITSCSRHLAQPSTTRLRTLVPAPGQTLLRAASDGVHTYAPH